MWVADVRSITCDSFTSLLQACSKGPFRELGLDLRSGRPWWVPSWQVCEMLLGKWEGKGIYGWEEKHSLWSGRAGSCDWLQEEAMLEGRWVCYSAASPVLNTFLQGAGAGADGTKHLPLVGPGVLLQCWSLSNTLIMRGPAPHSCSRSLGPCSEGPKTPVLWIAFSCAVLIHTIELLKMGQQVSWELGKVFQIAHDMMQDFFCQYGALKLREEQPFFCYFWPS